MADRKCSHPGCDCKVSGDDQYCSDHCRQHGAHASGRCECGHSECQGTR